MTEAPEPPELTAARRALTPAQRDALGTCVGGDSDLSGLYDARTLDGLVSHGLARRERGRGKDRSVILTGLGQLLRNDLIGRVEARLAKKGYTAVGPDGPYRDERGVVWGRILAMQQAQVKW